MTREISQSSSQTSQSSDTDTPSEIIQNSSSGQTEDPNQQIQSSEEERNDAVTGTSEQSTRTPESNSSGIPITTGESTSYEQVRSPNQQIPPEETESVGADEPNRARPSTNSDIPRNAGQSSSSGECASSATTQQNLVSKHRRKFLTAHEQGSRTYAAIPRDVSESISQILDRHSGIVATAFRQRDQAMMNVTSRTSGQENAISKSTNKAPSSEETQSTSKKQSKDQNTVPQQISLTEQRTTSSTRGISEQGDETRKSTDRAGNKTQKVVNRRPEDSSHECRCRARRSKRSASRKDATPCQRSNQSEEARAIFPVSTADNAIRHFIDGIVDNPALRLSEVPLQGPTFLIRTNKRLVNFLEQCRRIREIRDTMERLAMQEHASGNPNSEERRTERRRRRRRGKKCSGKDEPPRSDGDGGGKQ